MTESAPQKKLGDGTAPETEIRRKTSLPFDYKFRINVIINQHITNNLRADTIINTMHNMEELSRPALSQAVAKPILSHAGPQRSKRFNDQHQF